MQSVRDRLLLRTFRLCRADMVDAMTASSKPPTAGMLRELAELQLVIMATEGTIADKLDADFARELGDKAA